MSVVVGSMGQVLTIELGITGYKQDFLGGVDQEFQGRKRVVSCAWRGTLCMIVTSAPVERIKASNNCTVC